MAWEANKYNVNNRLLIPMLDARRMEVYTMVVNSRLEILEDTQALVVSDDSFLNYENDQLVLFGNGAMKTQKHLVSRSNMKWMEHIFTSARSVGEIAQIKFNNQEFEDLAYYEPNYLKEFQAIKPKALL